MLVCTSFHFKRVPKIEVMKNNNYGLNVGFSIETAVWCMGYV